MTASDIAQLGLLTVVAILVGFSIPAIVQVRRTARAAEELLRGAGPRVESAAANLDSVLGRVDRVAGNVEGASHGMAAAFTGIGNLVGRLKPPVGSSPGGAAWLAAFTNLISGFWQAWSAYTGTHRNAAGHQDSAPETRKEGEDKNV